MHAVMTFCSCKLMTSELQFGFKPKSSTSHCTFVLKEALAYYMDNKSSVDCAFLDATKAFDRVNYCKLFRLLVRRNLPPLLLRVMLNFMEFLGVVIFLNIFWLNGVKQGGLLSPDLFFVYLDELLHALSAAKVGCYVCDIFVGALAYADDLVLTAHSATALRKMLAICDALCLRVYCELQCS